MIPVTHTGKPSLSATTNQHLITLVNNFYLDSQAHGKHLVQALPPVFTLQCLTGKADKTKQPYAVSKDK